VPEPGMPGVVAERRDVQVATLEVWKRRTLQALRPEDDPEDGQGQTWKVRLVLPPDLCEVPVPEMAQAAEEERHLHAMPQRRRREGAHEMPKMPGS